MATSEEQSTEKKKVFHEANWVTVIQESIGLFKKVVFLCEKAVFYK